MALQYPVVHINDVKPEVMDKGDGWRITDFRIPISKKQGSKSTMFHARFMPGPTEWNFAKDTFISFPRG